MNKSKRPDLVANAHGSVVVLNFLSERAKAWRDEYLPDRTEFGGAVVVEHRYIGALVEGAINDGLEVR